MNKVFTLEEIMAAVEVLKSVGFSGSVKPSIVNLEDKGYGWIDSEVFFSLFGEGTLYETTKDEGVTGSVFYHSHYKVELPSGFIFRTDLCKYLPGGDKDLPGEVKRVNFDEELEFC